MRPPYTLLAAIVAAADLSARVVGTAWPGFYISLGPLLGLGPVTSSSTPLLWPFPYSRVLYAAAGFVCCTLLLLFERRDRTAMFQTGRWLALGGIGANYLGWALWGSSIDYIWLGQHVAANAADIATVAGLALYFGALLARVDRFWPQLRRGEGGYVLVWALLVVAILVTLAAAVTATAFTSVRSARAWHDRVAALYAAESGIEAALYELKENGRRPQDLDGLTIRGDLDQSRRYTVTFEGSGHLRTVVSTGYTGNATRRVRLDVRFEGPPLFPPVPPNSAVTEIRDDNYQDYEPPDITFDIPAPPPDVRSRGSLRLDGGQELDLGPGVYWFEGITLEDSSSLKITGPATIYVRADRRKADKADVEIDDATLTVSGDVTFYISGDIDAEDGSLVAVTGTANFYVGGDVSFDGGLTSQGETWFYIIGGLDVKERASLGQGPASSLIFVFSTDQPCGHGGRRGHGHYGNNVTINKEATIVGGIYAKTRNVEMKKESHLTGAVVGCEVDASGPEDPEEHVSYDASLKQVMAPGGTSGRWVVETGSWSAS